MIESIIVVILLLLLPIEDIEIPHAELHTDLNVRLINTLKNFPSALTTVLPLI
jgi:hypothetical protein